MGSPETAESPNRIGEYWQQRSVKHSFEGGEVVVEEVKTPWDLLLEGRWLGSPVGTDLHQILVKNGVERIFSLRGKDGQPYCDILTRPKGAPPISIEWAPRRGFLTSYPMVVDGQKLIVMDAIGFKGMRVDGQLMELAKKFFTINGGKLKGEHPNGLVFKESDTIRKWRDIVEKKIKIDLMVSTNRLKGEDIRPNTIHAPNAEIAIHLLSSRYWELCHFDGNAEWPSQVMEHMERNPDDQPHKIWVHGESERAKALLERAKEMFAKGSAK